MKVLTTLLCSILLCSLSFMSCRKDNNDTAADQQAATADILQKIKNLGYNTADIQKTADGYVVEGDILLTAENIQNPATSPTLKVAGTEQYRTNHLITGLPRVVTVSITGLPGAYSAALDEAIARYNALDLRLSFERVSNDAQIVIQYADLGKGVAARSAGFPTSKGEPASPIKLNAGVIGSNPDKGYLATLIAHELGHAIGLRHTDYLNNAYSCSNSTPVKDAVADAIKIPGTPSTGDPNSWMLACNDGKDRPFTANDAIALANLFGSRYSGDVVNTTVTADGTIIGVGTDHQLYTRATLVSPWVLVPSSGAVIAVTIQASGAFLAIGTDNQLYTRATLTSNWVLVPNSGSVIDIAVLFNGTLVAVGTDNQLYTRTTLYSAWKLVPNSGSVIALSNHPNGSYVGVGTDNLLYTRATLTSNWIQVPGSGSVIAVTVLPNGALLAVGTNNQLYTRATLTSPWVLVP
ncbi:M57 family metalloprotease [Chitinophaga nivalis]|uniref:M57 family metalloprotease n=1 Tax=Chitinophaga nivalis TaxID=2991709 RepID=A0ABT3IGX1_9BACT|nr:M57 family metalloprotease [Chitinophaga nivalis]MCW3467091.1 M57 family metalloprotease [Chitinophaga nivalis]MCW3483218.1 M57 family metalloprotease [Chitinophaga nivalis]